MSGDKVVDSVINDLISRSKVGQVKYNVTLEDSGLTLRQYLQHAYEEILDQANYLKGAILILENNEKVLD